MSRTSETPGSGAAGEYRCGACENCRRDPRVAMIIFPLCQATPDWRCGVCDNCRPEGPIQFENCHEVDEIRCQCGKCLAKDGQIKCTRCDTVTDTRPRLLDEARHTAFFLSALATTSQILGGGRKPLKITIQRGVGHLGYVHHVPADGPYLLTAMELKTKLVILLTGLAAEKALGSGTTGSSNVVARAKELARRMVTFGMVEGWDTDPEGAALRVYASAMDEATSFVLANRAAIDTLAAELLYKGELTGDDVARLTAGITKSGA